MCRRFETPDCEGLIMSIIVQNIFHDCQAAAGEEKFVTLCENASVKIERIVSHSYSSPENFWYDQGQDEWVMVLRGAATLAFAGGEMVELKSGDYLTIPRHLKHRVARTGAETIWLAVHIK
jgi:cupin 2 domain-containing protein